MASLTLTCSVDAASAMRGIENLLDEASIEVPKEVSEEAASFMRRTVHVVSHRLERSVRNVPAGSLSAYSVIADPVDDGFHYAEVEATREGTNRSGTSHKFVDMTLEHTGEYIDRRYGE